MKKRILAMVLAAAFCVTLGIAADPESAEHVPELLSPPGTMTFSVAPPDGQADTPGDAQPPAEAPPKQTIEKPVIAEPSTEPSTEEETPAEEEEPKNSSKGTFIGIDGKIIKDEETMPDGVSAPVKPVGYNSIESIVRQHNLTIKSNNETLQGIKTMDYKAAKEGLEFQLEMLRGAQSKMQSAIRSLMYFSGSDGTPDTGTRPTEDEAILLEGLGAALGALNTQYAQSIMQAEDQLDSLQDTIADINDNYLSASKQFEGVEKQLIMGAQSLYLTLGALDVQQRDLQRNLATLDRTIGELKRRHELGQISELQLLQAQNQRAQLDSGLETLKMQVRGLQVDLTVMLGYDADAELSISPLPATPPVAKSYDEDLKQVIRNSYTLFSKNDAMAKASNDYKRNNTASGHNYEAARIAYQAAEQQIVGSFRKLYDTVDEKKRLFEVAQGNEEYQNRLYEVAITKYKRGMISLNAYEDAKDEYAAAQSATRRAEIELFTTVHQYNWAKQGVLS